MGFFRSVIKKGQKLGWLITTSIIWWTSVLREIAIKDLSGCGSISQRAPTTGPPTNVDPYCQPVGRRDIRKASENPQMFTPSRGSHKEEGFPDEPVMQPFALFFKPFLTFCLLVFLNHFELMLVIFWRHIARKSLLDKCWTIGGHLTSGVRWLFYLKVAYV